MIRNEGSYRLPVLAAGVVVMLSLTVSTVWQSDPAAAGDGDLERRLQAVEDEKAIRDLMVEYGQHLDTLDFAAYSGLFAADGEWSGQLSEYTTVKGPAAIRSAMEEAFAERIYDPQHVTNVHLLSNISIDVSGDRATGYSKWTVISRSESGQPYVRVSGHYDDVYVREDGRWKFQSRVARREMH